MQAGHGNIINDHIATVIPSDGDFTVFDGVFIIRCQINQLAAHAFVCLRRHRRFITRSVRGDESIFHAADANHIAVINSGSALGLLAVDKSAGFRIRIGNKPTLFAAGNHRVRAARECARKLYITAFCPAKRGFIGADGKLFAAVFIDKHRLRFAGGAHGKQRNKTAHNHKNRDKR